MRSLRALTLLAAAMAVVGAVWLLVERPGAGGAAPVLAAPGADAGAGGDVSRGADVERDGEAGEGAVSRGREGIAALPDAPPAEAAGAQSERPLLFGRVVTPAGVPIEGAEVFARRSDYWLAVPADMEAMGSLYRSTRPLTTTSDEEGRFSFEDVAPGNLSFALRAHGRAVLQRPQVSIPPHERLDLGDFELSSGILVEGRAIDTKGRGVAGVAILRAITPAGGSLRLELPGFGAPLASTDENGGFRVDTLAPGGWHLIFDSPAHRVTELQGVTEPAGQVASGLLVRLDPGLEIRGRLEGIDLAREGALRVTARRAKEQPAAIADDVAGAEKHRPRHAPVAPDGSFALAGLAPGTQYRLTASAPPEKEEDERWRPLRGVDEVLAMSGAREVVLRYRPIASLSFRAVDALSGAAVTRFSTSVAGSGLSGGGLLEADGDEPLLDHPGGAARFEDLRPAERGSALTLRIDAPGYELFDQGNVMLRPGDEKDLGSLSLKPAAGILVTVVDRAGGEPVPDARVLLARASEADALQGWLDPRSEREPWRDARVRHARTDERGRARLTAPAGEVCVIKAVAAGFIASEELRAVPPHEERELELALKKGGRVLVQVQTPAGDPVPGVFIQHKPPGGQIDGSFMWDADARARRTTDERGQKSFEDLPVGAHEFQAIESGDLQQRMVMVGWNDGSPGREADPDTLARVQVGEGTSERVELKLPARGGLRGVLLEGGRALVGAFARVQRLDPDEGGRNVFGWWGPQANDPTTCVSDHAGRIAFEGLCAGRYELIVTHPERRMPFTTEVELEPGPREQRFELGLASIEGIVLGENGEPLSRLDVNVRPAENRRYYGSNDYKMTISEGEGGDTEYEYGEVGERRVRTGQDGRYELRGVAPDEDLIVSVDGAHVVAGTERVAPLLRDESRRGVDFNLEAAGCLDVRLAGGASGDRRRFQVKLVHDDGGGVTTTRGLQLRGNQPRRTLCSLPPGRWVVEVRLGNEKEPLATAEGEVRARETTTVVVELP